MNKILVTILITLTVFSCQQKDISKFSAISRVDSLKNSLIGKWGGLDEDGPVFRISHDSIYNFGDNKSCPYKIIRNDLVFDNGQSKPHLRNISVVKDTLFFETRVSVEKEVYGVVKAFRYK